MKVPLDQDDQQFTLKIIEDLNKIWENLNFKKMFLKYFCLKKFLIFRVKEKTKIKSPEYDFFLEELTKADFKKDKKSSREKQSNNVNKNRNIILSPIIAEVPPFDVSEGGQRFFGSRLREFRRIHASVIPRKPQQTDIQL